MSPPLPSAFQAILALCAVWLLRRLYLLICADCDLTTYTTPLNAAFFRGKVAWITGASSGIGLALAKRLAREGCLLVLTSRRSDTLDQIADALPCPRSNVHVLALDLAADPPPLLHAAARSVQEVHGRLDYIFNNAGLSTRATAEDLDPQHVAHVLQLNFLAPAALARACLPALREAPGGQGTIVNTLSIAAIVHTPLRSSYCAAKAALAAYAECLRLEEPKVRVVNVYPGSVRTCIDVNAITAGGKAFGKSDPNIAAGLEPERVADRMLAAVSAGLRTSWIAPPKELAAVRFSQMFPSLWARISVLLADGYRRKIEES